MSLLLEWYGTLSQLYAAVADPLIGLARSTGLPPVAALLLGLLATFSPCQLTTNASAIAWGAREAAGGRRAAGSAAAFILGKAAVYMLLGVGVAFAFAFCPTLALLFFSLLLPLTLARRGGFLLPALFAVGTALPLIGFTALLLAGGRLAERYTSRAGALGGPVRAVAGTVFLLAGISDTLLYWALG